MLSRSCSKSWPKSGRRMSRLTVCRKKTVMATNSVGAEMNSGKC